MVGGLVAECGMPPFGVVRGDVAVDFKPGFGRAGEAAAPTHSLQRAVFGDQGFEAGGRVLAALVGVDDEPN